MLQVLQHVLHMSRQEEMYARRAREEGRHYEHGGGSSQAEGSCGSGLMNMLMRSKTVREPTAQPRIDTGPWTAKRQAAKKAIGKAWSKWFHAEAIPGVKANSPYFTVAVKETQRWGM